MGFITTTVLLRGLINWLVLATMFGALASWVWVVPRLLRHRPVLPETPLVERRTPPWGIGTMLLLVTAWFLVSMFAPQRYAAATRGKHDRPRAEAAVHDVKKPGAEPALDANGRHAEAESLPWGLSLTELMFVQAAINSILIVLLPVIARLTSGIRLRGLGLSLRAWRTQVAVGTVAVLFLMPIVYTVQLVCVQFLDIPDPEHRRHPVERMIRDNFSPGVAYLALLTAVILAPAFEELLFRGFIQSWLVKTFDRLGGRSRRPLDDEDAEIPDWDAENEPQSTAAPEIATARHDVMLDEIDDPGTFRKPTPKDADDPDRPGSSARTYAAIVLTSLIFAALHAPQWPAPIPLFILSLGIGLVYQRTGSLLAAICMHAIFNGFSTLTLLSIALEPPREKPAPGPVLERVGPVEKGVAVPDVRLKPRGDKT